jgi:hypothetical protein
MPEFCPASSSSSLPGASVDSTADPRGGSRLQRWGQGRERRPQDTHALATRVVLERLLSLPPFLSLFEMIAPVMFELDTSVKF